MIYFLCGHKGCGKSYLANQIKKEREFTVYDTGPILRNQHMINDPYIPFYEWVSKNQKIFGKNFTNMVICENMAIDNQNNIIINGNRSMIGIEFIINYFNIKDYKVLYIDGDYELFRENYNNRENENISFKEYMNFINIENEMGIEEIKRFSKDNKENGLYFYKSENNNEIYKEIIKDIEKHSINKVKTKIRGEINNDGLV